MAMLEPTLPIWLIDTMHPPKWQLGRLMLCSYSQQEKEGAKAKTSKNN